MSSKQQGKVRVKALRAYTRDVGKDIARIDPKTMDLLGVTIGGVLEVVGNRRTVCKCMPLFKGDLNKDIVRLDGLVRENAGLEVGDDVSVRKIDVFPAERISLASLTQSAGVEDVDDQVVKESLGGVPFVLGDRVLIQFGLDKLPFIVLDALPKAEGYLVNERTNLEVLPPIT
jgi:transitional endoplasmic reticulum ATPase